MYYYDENGAGCRKRERRVFLDDNPSDDGRNTAMASLQFAGQRSQFSTSTALPLGKFPVAIRRFVVLMITPILIT